MERWYEAPANYAYSPEVPYVPVEYYLEIFGMGAELIRRHADLAQYVACVAGFKKHRLERLEPLVRFRKQLVVAFAYFPCEAECHSYAFPGQAPDLEAFEELRFINCGDHVEDPTNSSRYTSALVHDLYPTTIFVNLRSRDVRGQVTWVYQHDSSANRLALAIWAAGLLFHESIHLAEGSYGNAVDQHVHEGCDRIYAAENSFVMALARMYDHQLHGSNCWVAYAADPQHWMSGDNSPLMCELKWVHDCGTVA